MKRYIILAICGIATAVVVGAGTEHEIWVGRNAESEMHPNVSWKTVEWQFDWIRKRKAELQAQRKAADEFNRTNTNPAVGMFVEWDNIQWKPDKGSKELGYRSDGVVVWRDLPEGK